APCNGSNTNFDLTTPQQVNGLNNTGCPPGLIQMTLEFRRRVVSIPPCHLGPGRGPLLLVRYCFKLAHFLGVSKRLSKNLADCWTAQQGSVEIKDHQTPDMLISEPCWIIRLHACVSRRSIWR